MSNHEKWEKAFKDAATKRIVRFITDAVKESLNHYIGEEEMSEEKTMSFKAKMPDGREVECPAPDQKEWTDTGEGYKKIPEKDQEIILVCPQGAESDIHTCDKRNIVKTSGKKGTVRHDSGRCYMSDMSRHLTGKAKLTAYTIWKKKK